MFNFIKCALAVCTLLIIFSCFDYTNPLDPKNDQDSNIYNGPDSAAHDTAAPLPGNNGELSIIQTPGRTYLRFIEAEDDYSKHNEIKYRALIGFNEEFSTNSSFNHQWMNTSPQNSMPVFEAGRDTSTSMDNYETGVSPRQYAVEIIHNSKKGGYLSLQSGNISGNQALYTTAALKVLPSYNDSISGGSSLNDQPLDGFNALHSKIVTDSQGYIYLAINYNEEFDADPSAADSMVTYTGPSGSDVALIKYDTDLNYQWHRTISSPGEDLLYDLFISRNDTILLSVSYNDIPNSILTISNPGGDNTNTRHSNSACYDSVIIEYNTIGNYVTKHELEQNSLIGDPGNVFVTKILEDSANNRYFIGMALNDIIGTSENWAPGDIQINDLDGDGGLHKWFGFVIMSAENNNFLDFKYFGEIGPTGNPAQITISDAIIDKNDHLYISGLYFGDFDPAKTFTGISDPISFTSSSGNLYVMELSRDSSNTLQYHNTNSISSVNGLDPNAYFALDSENRIYLGFSGIPQINFENGWYHSIPAVATKEIIITRFTSGLNGLKVFNTNAVQSLTVMDIGIDQFDTLYLIAQYPGIPKPPDALGKIVNLGLQNDNTFSTTMPNGDPLGINSFLATYIIQWNQIRGPLVNHFNTAVGAHKAVTENLCIRDDKLYISGYFNDPMDPSRTFKNALSPDIQTPNTDTRDLFLTSLNIY